MLQYNPSITGSLQVTGSLVVTGNIIASGSITISGSVASASYAEFLGGLPSSSFASASVFNTVSSSYAASSASLSTRVTNVEATASTNTQASASFAAQSASLSTRLTTDETNFTNLSSSFATTSGSVAGRVTLIEGQYATTGSNTFTKPQRISDVSNAIGFASTASLYTDGGLRVTKDSFVSGTAYFNNVVVYGTSSIQYITSSQLNIGTNIINLNTDTPAIRFGGIAVADSGSNAGITGSLLWDSQNNRWIYSNPSGSTYDGGMLMSGPRNTTGLGNEVGTTACAVVIGQGGDHITSSGIFSYGNATCFYGTSFISSSGAMCIGGSLTGVTACLSTAICSDRGYFTGISLGGTPISATTNATQLRFTNSGGDLYVGQEGSVAGGFYPGASAYDNVIYTNCPVNIILGGTSRFYITNSGLIGLSTKSPSAELQINKNCDVTLALSNCINVTSGNRGSIAWYNCATSTVANIRATAVTDNVGTQLEFYTRCAGGSLTQNLTISSLGQLFVNTTNWPTCVAANSANRHIFGGSTEPTIFLWNEATAAANNQSTIWLGAKSATGANYIGGGYIAGGLENATNSCGYLVFRTTDTTAGTNERMRITSGGCVGINTTSPCARLHVQGAANAEDLLYFCTGGSVNTKFVYNINSGADDAFILRRNHTTQGNLCVMAWTYQGFVGIGCMTPTAPLTIRCDSSSTASSLEVATCFNASYRYVSINAGNGISYCIPAGTSQSPYIEVQGGFPSAGGGSFKIRTGAIGSPSDRLLVTQGGLILACGRTSSILASNGNIQEYVGSIGSVANNTGWSLFCINNQFDVLSMDIYVFTDVGSYQASKHNIVFGYTQFTNNAIGFASAFCAFSTGTLYFETMRICNLSGSLINSQRVAIRVWGYGVGQDGSGGSNLLNTSCLTRIK